jgi:hypothetical protein
MISDLSTCLSSGQLSGATMSVPRIGGNAVAKMASYGGSRGSATTRTGGYYGTNPNQPISLIQAVGMAFTSEMIAKDGGVGWSYIRVRNNYCRPIGFKPNTGNPKLNKTILNYCNLVWQTMGVGRCSMWAALARTIHIEVPIRGDAGLIFHRDRHGKLRLLEFSADMVGEPFFFINPRNCSLAADAEGNIREVPGRNLVYYAGRYYDGPDCIAYKIYQRNAAGFWSNPEIYAADDVIYCVDPLNFRSIRGVTIFAQCLKYMQKSEDLLQSALSIAQRQARTFGRVFNNSGTPNGNAQYEQAGFTWDEAVQTFFEKIPGGPLEEYRFNGDSAEFTNPTAPGAPVIQGIDAADQKALTALGVTWGFVMSYEKLGGAPARLDVDRCDKEWTRIKEDISTPPIKRIVKATILEGVREGAIPPDPDIFNEVGEVRGDIMFTTSATADSYKDSQSNIKESRAGQTSDTIVAAQYNLKIDDIIQDKKEEAVKRAVALKEAKEEAIAAGVKEEDLPTRADISQSTDNPQQEAQAENLEQGKPTTITKTNKTGDNSAALSVAKMALALLAEHDVSGENRDDSGEWTSGGGASRDGEKAKPSNAPESMPKETKESKRRRDATISNSKPAKDSEFYHGTAFSNVESILKNGINPTDNTLGFHSSFMAAGKDLAFAYGSGSAAGHDDDKIAVIVANGKNAGLLSPSGADNIGYKPGVISPDKIDRIEIYRVGAGKDEKPIQVIHPNATK